MTSRAPGDIAPSRQEDQDGASRFLLVERGLSPAPQGVSSSFSSKPPKPSKWFADLTHAHGTCDSSEHYTCVFVCRLLLKAL